MDAPRGFGRSGVVLRDGCASAEGGAIPTRGGAEGGVGGGQATGVIGGQHPGAAAGGNAVAAVHTSPGGAGGGRAPGEPGALDPVALPPATATTTGCRSRTAAIN